MEFLKELSKQIPKLFKYLVPGLLFVVLCVFSFPKDAEPLLLKLIGHHPGVFLLLGGIGIYCIHRLIFWIIDEIALKQYSQNCWGFFTTRFGKAASVSDSPALLDHMDYRWEIIQTCLIMAELTFVFALLAQEGSIVHAYRIPIIECSIVLFVISAGLYFYLGKLELENLGLTNPPAKSKKQPSKSPARKTSRKR